MLNKFFIIFILFIILNLSNIFSYFYNYLWEKNFNSKNIISSEKNFSKSLDNFWKYNLANLYYKNWEFEKARDLFENIKGNSDNNLDFLVWASLWNTYFRIWEKKDKEEKEKNFLESILNYDFALSKKYNKKVEENKKFVEEKLKKQKNKKWENNDKKSDLDSKKDNFSDDNQKSSWKMENQTNSWKTEEEKKLEKSEDKKLTEEEKKEIENYQKYLEQSQKEFMWNFDKNFREKDDFFDLFSDNIFEDYTSWKEKDW